MLAAAPQAPTAQEVTQQAAPADFPFKLIIDPSMPPNTMRMESGKSSVTAININFDAPATQQAAKAETAEQALNGIPATMRHDEGAIARCSYCGRYSLDPATLLDRQPTCECGKQHGWSGSFKRPGPDAKWNGKAPDLAPTTSTVSAPIVQAEYVGKLRSTLHAIANTLDDNELRGAAREAYDLAAPSSTEGTQEAPEEVRNQALEEVAKLVEKKVYAYTDECGTYDHTTGVTEYPGNGEEWVGEMGELADEIRALKTPGGAA
jgi:hypothetical protein